MLFRHPRIRRLISSTLAPTATSLAVIVATGATALACETAPSTTITDTAGQTFIAFCDDGQCTDIEPTDDTSCDDYVDLRADKMLAICISSECRPIACGQDSDCDLYWSDYVSYACTNGLCLDANPPWHSGDVEMYCLRDAPRTEECRDDYDSPPFVTAPSFGGTCPHEAGDRRCAAYELCGDNGTCDAPTVCDQLD